MIFRAPSLFISIIALATAILQYIPLQLLPLYYPARRPQLAQPQALGQTLRATEIPMATVMATVMEMVTGIPKSSMLGKALRIASQYLPKLLLVSPSLSSY